MSSPGKLIVKPIKAKITYNTEWFGKMDPFVVLEFEKQKQQSQVCNGGGYQPYWQNTLSFNRLNSNLLYISLLDHQSFKSHDIIGTVQIDISDIFIKTQSTTRWVDVYRQSKVTGKIQFQFFFQGIQMNQSNFKGSGGGSLMMSKKSKLGMKQNPYQQPQIFNNPSNNQINNGYSQQYQPYQKPPSYQNYPQQRFSNNNNNMNKTNQPYSYPDGPSYPINYGDYNSSNNQYSYNRSNTLPEPYLAERPSYSQKKSTFINFNQSQQKVSNGSQKFSAEQMDNFLDD